MTNIASVLKAEISRISRKEVRTETASLKKAVVGYRAEIAALKRRAQVLEQEVKKFQKSARKASPEPAATDETGQRATRFSAKGLASQRKRLGLSASDCGLLLGTSGQSVYNWEAGSARPRAKVLPAIAALKGLGKKEVAAILERLRAA